MRLTSDTRTGHERCCGGSDWPAGIDGTGVDDEVGTCLSQAARRSGRWRCRSRTDRRPARSGVDASERSPRRATEALMPVGSNHAISSATVVVVSSISVSAPPMIPARPIGRSSASQINRSSAPSVRSTSSSVVSVSPASAGADPEPVAAERRQVVGVVRLAELEHHVVADVDDVVDRAHAGCGEPLGHPRRRRSDDDAGRAPST